MPDPVVVETLEAVPEALRSLFKPQDDGKFSYVPEDVGALRRSLENAKTERKAAKEALEKLQGVDVEEYNTLKAEREQREMEKATKKGEFEKLREQLVTKHGDELKLRDQKVDGMRAALESYLVDAEATRAIAASKGVPELLLPHVKSQVKVFEENGRYAARVVDRDGQPRIGDASGAPMSITQLVAEMRASEVFGRAFEASSATGGGAPPQRTTAGGGQKVITRAAFDALDVAAKHAHIKSGGTVTD